MRASYPPRPRLCLTVLALRSGQHSAVSIQPETGRGRVSSFWRGLWAGLLTRPPIRPPGLLLAFGDLRSATWAGQETRPQQGGSGDPPTTAAARGRVSSFWLTADC